MKRLVMAAVMRVKPARGGSNAGGCGPPTSSDRRSGAIARRSAILLSGTAAVALSIAQPASAITINDQVAAAAGGVANYYDAGNQFPNVVSLFSGGSFCTGSLINSRTILTAVAQSRSRCLPLASERVRRLQKSVDEPRGRACLG
jgi:hypothetical protein